MRPPRRLSALWTRVTLGACGRPTTAAPAAPLAAGSPALDAATVEAPTIEDAAALTRAP
jgi:hypothetical protein